MRFAYVFLWVYAFPLGLNAAAQLKGQSYTSCGLIDKKIFCFGGTHLDNTYSNKLYSLDTINFTRPDGTSTSSTQASQQWAEVTAQNSATFIIEPRRKASSFVYGNNTLLVYGGYTFNGTKVNNQTFAYRYDTNSWETLPNYEGMGNETKQIYDAACVYHPSDNTALFYGGATFSPIGHSYNSFDSVVSVNTTIDKYNNTIDNAGFMVINKLDLNTKVWSILSPQHYSLSVDSYTGQTATFHPDSGLIYYLGGFYMTNKDNYKSGALKSYNFASAFNTFNGNWSNVTLGGKAPTKRRFPTATLMPNSADILLYGGGPTSDNQPSLSDVCYTLNLVTNNWTYHELNSVVRTNPSRYAHSAVLIDTTLFLLFGISSPVVALDDMIILDVSSVSNITIQKYYPYNNTISIDNSSSTTKENNRAIEPLSTGAIVGISIGCAIVLLGIIASLMLFYLKRKKLAKEAELAIAREARNNDYGKESKIEDELQVDWDQIDNQLGDSNYIRYHLSWTSVEKPSIRTYSPNSYEQVSHSRQNSDMNLSSLPSNESSNGYKSTLYNQYTTNTPSSLSNEQTGDVLLIKPDLVEEHR